MHTVITWRNRPSANGHLRETYENPCSVILGNALCYIISGLILLVIGVVITSATFQNLEGYEKNNTERFAGPILIVVGVLVLARGAFNHLRPSAQTGSNGVFIRSYTGELFTRPIMDYSSNSVTLCSVSIGETHENPRGSLHDDEPPSYDVVMGSVVEHRIGSRPETRDECTQSPDDFSEPPPTYEEFIMNIDSNTASIGSPSLPSDCETKTVDGDPDVPYRSSRVLERMNTV